MNDYKIKKLMEEMEKELIISMKRNLSNHLKEEDKIGFKFPQWQAIKLKEMKKYQRENKNIIDNYTKGLNKDISNHLRKELTQGSKNSIKEYNGFASNKIKASKMLNKSFFKTNDRKVNSLIKVVNNDLKIANTSALRMINDEYRQVIHKSTFFLANGVVSPQKAIDMATKDFLTRGLNCIEYKDGRRVNIASYSEMAVRTASLRAQLMGDGDFRESIGRHLVIATASNAACPLCSKWENKIMIDDVYSGGSKKDGNYPLLSEAMKQGFLHPNCRDGIATYYPELEDIDKSYEDGKDGSESDEAYQEDLNYINQKIKQFERLSIGSIDEENIQHYESQKNAWEEKKKSLTIMKLTEDEEYAISYYLGSDSYRLNEKLRNGIELTEYESKIVHNLDKALSKLNNYDGIVKRSLSINSDDLEYFLKDYEEGKEVIIKSYVSSTIGDTYNPEARVQYFIKSKSGKNLIKYNKLEQEILFIRNTKFLVNKVDTTDDFFVTIYLEEK